MPTYDYQCRRCTHRFDIIQSMKAVPLKRCPKCGGRVDRLIGSGGGLIFKGSGFYITDYKNVSPTKGEGADKKPEKPKEKETKAEPAKKKDE